MSRYSHLISSPIPQTEPLDERQVLNHAGGYGYQIDIWKRLERFLILGSDSNTYYQKARDLTRENAACVETCYKEDAARAVDTIVEISSNGRAPRNSPAIFALALGVVNEDVKVRQLAYNRMPRVCRTATHLFEFLKVCAALKKGWGRGLKRAVANWYNNKSVDQVAYQMVKYRSRETMNHSRAIKLINTAAFGYPERVRLYNWAHGKDVETDKLPQIVQGHIQAMLAENHRRVPQLIRDYRLPWEAIPTEVRRNPEVWKAMMPSMGLTAMIRELGHMTEYGAVGPLSAEAMMIQKRLTDANELWNARIHPFNLLVAHAVYRSGKSVLGKAAWTPLHQLTGALEDAFHLSFSYVEPAGKRTLVAVDVSASMSVPIMNSPLTAAEACAALAMTVMRTEPQSIAMAFANEFRDLGIDKHTSLSNAIRKTTDQNFGSTDCAVPMVWARQRAVPIDTFIVLTDNETWAGPQHVTAALREYRDAMKIPSKVIVVGMTATKISIADPHDPGMLDIVGFDSNCPALIADFSRGG